MTFLSPYARISPQPFPYQHNLRIIAAYQCDVDTTYGGEIWFRELKDLALLRKAKTEIRTVFPQQKRFNAAWNFITTWHDLNFFGADDFGKLNVRL